MRLRREKVQAEKQVGRKKIPRAGIVALAVFAPFLLASGPAPKKPESAPQKITVSKEDFRWFPAFMLVKGADGFSLKDVSLGFTPKGLDDIYSLKIEGDHCKDVSDNKVMCYESPSDIGRKSRIKHRKKVSSFLSNRDGLATKNPKLLDILQYNVYFMLPSGCAGRYVPNSLNDYTYMIVDGEGIPLPPCKPAPCYGFDILNFSDEVGEETKREVFLHEILHDGWFGLLSKQSKKGFLSLIKPLCNDCGIFSPSRIWFMAMTATAETNAMAMLHETKLCQGLIKSFIHEKFPSLSEKEKEELKEALGWYLDLRALLDNNVMVQFLGIEMFIKLEAYPYLFDSKLVPYAFREFYLPVIDEKELDSHIFAPGNSHLSSVENIEALLPILKAFVSYTDELLGFESTGQDIRIEAGFNKGKQD